MENLAITTFYTPVFEGGAKGQPVPFTIEVKGLPLEYAVQVLKEMPYAIQRGDLQNKGLFHGPSDLRWRRREQLLVRKNWTRSSSGSSASSSN